MDGLISDKNHHRALNDSLNSDKNSPAVVLYSQDEGAFSETAAILETFQEKWECKMLFKALSNNIPRFLILFSLVTIYLVMIYFTGSDLEKLNGKFSESDI